MTEKVTGAGELDLRQLVSVLWNERVLIGAFLVLITAIAVLYALLAEELYRSEAVVQPREGGGSAPYAGLAAQFGGLAELAGLPVGIGGDRAVAVATLTSRTVLERFIEDRQLLKVLYDSAWDEEANRWRVNDPDDVPTSWQAYSLFLKRNLTVKDDKKTGLVKVTLDWEDPAMAQDLLTALISRVNNHLRAEAIKEGEANLEYLASQSAKIGQVALQQSLYGLVEAELKKLMIARGGEEFALKTIDPPSLPTKRHYPKRRVIVGMGLFLGLLLGVVSALVRDAFR